MEPFRQKSNILPGFHKSKKPQYLITPPSETGDGQLREAFTSGNVNTDKQGLALPLLTHRTLHSTPSPQKAPSNVQLTL